MKIRGTDFVMFEVSDLAAAARFYRDVLGLPQEIYSEQYHWAEFNCGNVTLSLKGGAMVVEGGMGARIVCQPQGHGVCQHLEVLDPDGNLIILDHRADGTFGQSRPDVKPAACP